MVSLKQVLCLLYGRERGGFWNGEVAFLYSDLSVKEALSLNQNKGQPFLSVSCDHYLLFFTVGM